MWIEEDDIKIIKSVFDVVIKQIVLLVTDHIIT